MTDDTLHDSTDSLDELFEEEEASDNDSFAEEETTTSKSTPEDRPMTPADKHRAKQAQVWGDRILSGEADISDLPKDKKWLVTHINSYINSQETSASIEALVEKKLRERESKAEQARKLQQIEKIKEEIKSLDSEDKAFINAKRKQLLAKGLGSVEALNEAMDYFNVYTNASESKRDELRKKLSVPKIQTKKAEEEVVDFTHPDFHKKGSDRDRIAQYESMMGNKHFRK
jgi:hypothetical protein